MGESTNPRSLSTFVLGTLPWDRMWTNHDRGWHFLLGIDLQVVQGVGPWFTTCRARGGSRLVIVGGHKS